MNPKGAAISEDGKYRYLLWRNWDPEKLKVVFIGLNPSAADAIVDDPTVRRCIGYAKTWGYGGLRLLNLFAFRTVSPKLLVKAQDPVGPKNDHYLETYSMSGSCLIACWGTFGSFRGRQGEVLASLPLSKVYCLGLTQGGNPKHLLYLRKSLAPTPWKGLRPRLWFDSEEGGHG